MAAKDPTKPDSHNRYLMMKPKDVAKDLEQLSSEETAVERDDDVAEHLAALSAISVKYLDEKFPEYGKDGQKIGPKRRGLSHIKGAADRTAHAESLLKRHVEYLKRVSYVNAAIAEGKTGKDLEVAKKKASEVAKMEVENKQFVRDFFNMYMRNDDFKDYESFINHLATTKKGLRGEHDKGAVRKTLEGALSRMHHTSYKTSALMHALNIAESDKDMKKEYISVMNEYLAPHGLKTEAHTPLNAFVDIVSEKQKFGKKWKPLKDDYPDYFSEMKKAT